MTAGAPGCIVFSHANSFPAGTYRRLFEIWRQAGHEVHAIEKYGHDPAYPVTNNWPHLRDQLIHFVESKAAGRPAYFVGHSLGGFLSVLAASHRPDLARGVVMLDSPIIDGKLALALAFAKATGLGERFSPAKISQRRRQHWPSGEAALAHFAAKPAFAEWDAQVLRDYIDAGIETAAPPHPPGQTLAFTRDTESAIYRHLPHTLPRQLRQHPLQCPAAFIAGRQSEEVQQVGLRLTERITQGRIQWTEGTHLFPFEHPQETAMNVLSWLQTFETARPPQ